mgnify:CR=1 FL=1
MAFELTDAFETQRGERPTGRKLAAAVVQKHPLAALRILDGGDAFDAAGGASPKAAQQAFSSWWTSHVTIDGASKTEAADIRQAAQTLLQHNLPLLQRLQTADRVHVVVLDEGALFRDHGFPTCALERAAGLFWHDTSWSTSRIGFRREHLLRTEALVAHEFAHAVHEMGFGDDERQLIYRVLRPTFGSRASMDEAFAIYSEHEFLDEGTRRQEALGKGPVRSTQASQFSQQARRGPGVYGYTRRQWSENQLFTRFMRKLYFPHVPLAGHAMGGVRSGSAWKKFMG